AGATSGPAATCARPVARLTRLPTTPIALASPTALVVEAPKSREFAVHPAARLSTPPLAQFMKWLNAQAEATVVSSFSVTHSIAERLLQSPSAAIISSAGLMMPEVGLPPIASK